MMGLAFYPASKAFKSTGFSASSIDTPTNNNAATTTNTDTDTSTSTTATTTTSNPSTSTSTSTTTPTTSNNQAATTTTTTTNTTTTSNGAGGVGGGVGGGGGNAQAATAAAAAKKARNAGVLIVPGGGYSFVSLDYEGADAVRWLNARGFDAWVLDYTTTCAAPAPLYPAPLEEAADAVRAIRACLVPQHQQHQPQWSCSGGGGGEGGGEGGGSGGRDGVDDDDDAHAALSAGASGGGGEGGDDPGAQEQEAKQRYRLGIWGFSAGAHLAALTLTRPDIEPLLDFAVLAYPVASMTPDDNDGDIVVAHLGSRRNLLGDGSTGHGVNVAGSPGSGGGGGSGGSGGGGGGGGGGAPVKRAGSVSGATVTAIAVAAAKAQQAATRSSSSSSSPPLSSLEEVKEKEKEKEDPFADVPDLQRRMSPHRAVGPRTPPVFIFHTANDPAVPVQNALLFAGAMARHARPFQLLILPDGRHGISLALDDPKLSWTGELERWLTHSVRVMG